MPLSKYPAADHVFAFTDELEIEKACLIFEPVTPDYAPILRRIDDEKIAGTYDRERARLQTLLSAENPRPSPNRSDRQSDPSQIQSDTALVMNFLAARRSPDPEVKQGITLLVEAFPDLGHQPWNHLPLLRLLRKFSTKPRGRPKIIPPWRNHDYQMAKIRQIVASGASVNAAALEVVDRRKAGQEEPAKHLAKLYRQKMKLRK